MKIDALKLERQQEGVDKWFNSSQFGASKDQVGCWNWATGVGKSFGTILVIKRLLRTPLLNIVIVVPNEALNHQWKKLLGEHLRVKDLIRIEVFTGSYIIENNIKIKTNILIVDELHLFLGDEFIKVINGYYIQNDGRLGLTATYEDPQGRHKMYNNIFPIIDEISEKEAIAKNFISAYKEFNLAVELTDEEEILYKKCTKAISENINKFDGSLTIATNCLSGGKDTTGKYFEAANFIFGWAKKKGWRENLNMNNPTDAQIAAVWNPNLVVGYAKNLMKAIRIRKDLMYGCLNKIHTTIAVIEKYKGCKSIVFGEKTDFADKVNTILNERYPNYSVVYHSQLATIHLPSPKTGKLIKYGKGRLKKMAIESIRTGRARNIATASSLDTGFDVADLEIGIIASGTANFNKQRQRGGRVKRFSDLFTEDKVKLIINLYVKDRVDETWLRKRQSKSSNEMFWIDSIDEIDFNPSSRREFVLDEII